MYRSSRNAQIHSPYDERCNTPVRSCMQAHPEDMLGDTCMLCARGDEQATDWVCCDRCGSWQHFSCDNRPGLGAFKVCPRCDISAQSIVGSGSASEAAELSACLFVHCSSCDCSLHLPCDKCYSLGALEERLVGAGRICTAMGSFLKTSALLAVIAYLQQFLWPSVPVCQNCLILTAGSKGLSLLTRLLAPTVHDLSAPQTKLLAPTTLCTPQKGAFSVHLQSI